jgi:hypothetical protein
MRLDSFSSQFSGLGATAIRGGVAPQSRQQKKFTACAERQRRRFQPWSYCRSDRNAANRSGYGPPIRGLVERAHGDSYLRVANTSVTAPGGKRERLLKHGFEWFGKIDGNPFHTSTVGQSEVPTKTVIRLDR